MVEYESSLMREVEGHLGEFAELLGTTRENVRVVFGVAFSPAFNRRHKQRDLLVESRPLGLAYLPLNGGRRSAAGDGYVGPGIHLFANRLDPAYRYVVYASSDGGHVFAVKRGELYRLSRLARRQNQITDVKPVVLPGDLVDRIRLETVGFLRKARVYKRLGARLQKGVVFSGPPGNGKTLMTSQLVQDCNNSGMSYATYSSKDLVANPQQTLNAANLVVVDDVDISLFSRRSAHGKACEVLSAMDSALVERSCVRVFTTNESIVDFDEAFTRPGRIDRVFTFEKPDAETRRRFFRSWPAEITREVSVDRLVEATDGFSFAEADAVRSNLVMLWLDDGRWDVGRAAGMVRLARERKKVGF